MKLSHWPTLTSTDRINERRKESRLKLTRMHNRWSKWHQHPHEQSASQVKHKTHLRTTEINRKWNKTSFTARRMGPRQGAVWSENCRLTIYTAWTTQAATCRLRMRLPVCQRRWRPPDWLVCFDTSKIMLVYVLFSVKMVPQSGMSVLWWLLRQGEACTMPTVFGCGINSYRFCLLYMPVTKRR